MARRVNAFLTAAVPVLGRWIAPGCTLSAANSPRDFEVLQCVGVICLNFGNLVRAVEGPAASLPLDSRCVQAFDEAHRVSPDHAEMIRLLKGARGNLRMTYEMLGRHDDALAQVEASLPLCSPAERSGIRVAKGLILARTGRHALRDCGTQGAEYRERQEVADQRAGLARSRIGMVEDRAFRCGDFDRP